MKILTENWQKIYAKAVRQVPVESGRKGRNLCPLAGTRGKGKSWRSSLRSECETPVLGAEAGNTSHLGCSGVNGTNRGR